jgi:tRNA dimethylallyltransferase
MRGIKHYCLDIANVDQRYSVVDWMTKAKEAIVQIRANKKLPIVCGGTGFYIDSLIHNYIYPELKSEHHDLKEKSTDELFDILYKLDPNYADKIDRDNRRKLEKAISLARDYGKVPEIKSDPSLGTFILIGIDLPDEVLRKRIRDRLIHRIDLGMIDEAKELIESGASYKRLDELGLEYRYLSELIQGKINNEQFIDILSTKIWQYARRQRTWFKNMKDIVWYGNPQAEENMNAIIDYINKKLHG